MKKLALKSCRIKNFKAIRDSEKIEFTPLTVFIGNNGSGKSSVIEALETMQAIVRDGLDEAMVPWHGFEYVRNQAVRHELRRPANGRSREENAVGFDVQGYHCEPTSDQAVRFFHSIMNINVGDGGNELYIERELYTQSLKSKAVRNSFGNVQVYDTEMLPLQMSRKTRVADGDSILSKLRGHNVLDWQFVALNPQAMGSPVPQKRTGGDTKLAKYGSNIADYLLRMHEADQSKSILTGIVETLQSVMPYARDIQPVITSELERNVYLMMTEAGFKLPGWLLSTGTMRILALLALLRHPKPPSVIFVEEAENGLDPRTIGLLVDELRSAVESGKTQVILTTHSPYLLNLLVMSQIVLVERHNGEPRFSRPIDNEEVKEWAKRFSPGDLYRMGQLSHEDNS